jgi:hypothetical protein
MLKQLVIPFFVLTVAAIGCGSSSSTPDAAGKAGTNGGAGTAAAGTNGAAGTAAAAGTNGAAGTAAAAGTNGAAGTAAAAGHDGGAAGTGSDGGAGTTGAAGHDGGPPDAAGEAGAIPACPAEAKLSTNTVKIDAVTFCKNFLESCSGLENGANAFTIPTAYSTEAMCEASWTANTAAVGCRSYHLCGNAVGNTEPNRKLHCPHALGLNGVCTN